MDHPSMNGAASIIGLSESNGLRGITYEGCTMEDFLEAHIVNDSKMDGNPLPPFYFPASNPSGPDIVFCISINDRKYPVFVQLKLRQVLSGKNATGAASTVKAKAIAKTIANHAHIQ
jgi:hypothetical protein